MCIRDRYSDDDLIASQSVVISQDGYTFDNELDKHQVIDVIQDQALGDVRHTRDPKVWIGKNGHIYMIVGSKIPSSKGYDGEVLFYESEDGFHFTYKNRFTDSSIGDMWECPDLICLDGQYFMIFSPENIKEPPYPNSHAVIDVYKRQGVSINSSGVFYTPVSESLHMMRGTFSMHMTIFSLVTAITSLFVPRLMEKFSYKMILTVSVFTAVVSTGLMALGNSAIVFYALGAIRGMSTAMFSIVPLTLVINGWFEKKHGLATSIVFGFSGLAGSILSLIHIL